MYIWEKFLIFYLYHSSTGLRGAENIMTKEVGTCKADLRKKGALQITTNVQVVSADGDNQKALVTITYESEAPIEV